MLYKSFNFRPYTPVNTSMSKKGSTAVASSAPSASTLPVTTLNNVRVYNISGNAHRSLPDWLVRRSARTLKKDSEWTRRVELIQDLEFPEASNISKFTPDGKFIVAAGTYKPQFRVFELDQMSMKFDRHTDAETVAFEVSLFCYFLMVVKFCRFFPKTGLS